MLKINGNFSPTVGKDYAYTIKAPIISYSLLPSFEPPAAGPFDKSCKWEVHVLENGKWRKTEENDKTGETVHYTFTQKSLYRKGIKIVVQKGNQKTEELVKPKKATEPKIVKVELLDSNSKKPSKPLSYGQTVIVKIHCTAHEYGMVNVTLWEDDAVGKGHNKINEKNFAQTKQAEVKRGIAETKFVLSPSFAKMAEAQKAKGDSSEGTTHEYYVTATIKNKNDASNNIEVNVPPAKPVPPLKKRVPVQTPDRPLAPIAASPKKPVVPVTPVAPTTPAKEVVGITHVSLIKKGETELQGNIYSEGLKGKFIQFKLYEHDNGSPNDLITDEKIEVLDNIMHFSIKLKELDQSKGGTFWEEGSEQELFVDIEVLQTHAHTKTEPLNVDITKLSTDPVDTTNKVVKVSAGKVEKAEKKEENCGEKYCIKKGDKSELIREINIRLAGFGGNVPTDEFTDRTEKMIKQFQKDYMKVEETGKVCGNVLKAIDDFQNKYVVNFDEIKCKCGKCTGYGNENNPEEYQNTSVLEKFRKYEYPGVHRSLICAYRASLFYLEKDKHLGYKTKCIESGYRCHTHQIYIATKTTNHCGKALDIHYNLLSTGKRTKEIADIEKIRLEIFNKYLGAKWDWKAGQQNIFNLESTAKSATTWVHVDVREFSPEFLIKDYFVKNNSELNGTSIVTLAQSLGFIKTCICNGGARPATITPANSTDRVDPKTLKASGKLIEFIKDWEKLEKTAYNDSKGFCTIGYGHLIKRKKCEDIVISDEFKDGITDDEATKLFKVDLEEFEKAVQRDVTVKLYQKEFDALVDLLFNCGAYFLSSGKAPKLYKNLLDEKYEDAAKEFLDIENEKRRKQNYEIFINENYDSTH